MIRVATSKAHHSEALVHRSRLALVIAAAILAVLSSGCSLLKVQVPPEQHRDAVPVGRPVKEIIVLGNQHTKTHVILRTMATQVGDTLTAESAAKNQEWLERLRVFTSIRFVTLEQPDGVTLFVQVTELTPYIPSISMEITDENGFSIGPAISSTNVAGTAAKIGGFARFGGATNFQVRFEAPWRPRRALTYSADVYWRNRRNKLDDFHEKAGEVYLMARRDVTESIRTGARVDFLSIGADTTGITLSDDNRDNLLSLYLSAEYDTRNDWANPTSGWRTEIVVGWNRGVFGTPARYYRLDLDLRRYVRLPNALRHSFAFYSLLTMLTGQVGVDVPIHQDFHIGGTNTVRGWELGARKGKNQFLNTIEYRFDLIPPRIIQAWFIKTTIGVSVAGLFDFGTAWNDKEGFADNLIGGYGAGVRLMMPVGMLRFDFARGQAGVGMTFHLGNLEKAEASRHRVR